MLDFARKHLVFIMIKNAILRMYVLKEFCLRGFEDGDAHASKVRPVLAKKGQYIYKLYLLNSTLFKEGILE